MENIEIAIIINSFNRLNLLKEGLRALNEHIPSSTLVHKCMFFIYDAGSTDGTREWYTSNKSQFKISSEIILPKEGEDTSFSSGINKGCQVAMETLPNLKYFLFYETDNFISSSVPIVKAIKVLETENMWAACGFTVKHHDGHETGVGMPFPRLFNFLIGPRLSNRLGLEKVKYHWKSLNDIKYSPVDVVYTSPLVVKKEAWIDSEGLDYIVFPFSDCDIDWAKRLSLKNWKMGVIETDQVIHDNKRELSNWSSSRDLHLHRARLQYFFRYHKSASYLVWPHFLFLRHMFEFVATYLFVWKTGKRGHLIKQFSGLLKTVLNKYKLFKNKLQILGDG